MNDVVFSCDDAGAGYLRVAVWSLLRHYRGSEPLRVNVLVGFGGHSEDSRSHLAELVGRFPGTVVRYIDAEPALAPYRELLCQRDGSRWNIFTWTPVFAPQLVTDAERLIHLDIDVLVNADISELFELDLQGRLLGAVYEYHCQRGSRHNAVWDAGVLPPAVERYFNTGVMVLDAARCRADATASRIVEWYREHYAIAERIEQDAWNALYHDQMLPLPVKWNFHDRQIGDYARLPLTDRYWFGNPPRECLEASLQPAILHFWGPKKPWMPSHRPYRKLYHQAMREVGLKVPHEEVFGAVNDFLARRHLRQIERRLATL